MSKFSDIETGSYFKEDDRVYRVVGATHAHVGRGGANITIKIKDLRDGKALTRTVKPADRCDEVEVEKEDLFFIYQKRDECWFKKGGERIMLSADVVGEKAKFLKPDMKITGVFVEDALVTVEFPIKETYVVKEAPPTMKGNTVQGSSKTVTLETGAVLSAPFFVEAGDTIVVNIEEERYVSRA